GSSGLASRPRATVGWLSRTHRRRALDAARAKVFRGPDRSSIHATFQPLEAPLILPRLRAIAIRSQAARSRNLRHLGDQKCILRYVAISEQCVRFKDQKERKKSK